MVHSIPFDFQCFEGAGKKVLPQVSALCLTSSSSSKSSREGNRAALKLLFLGTSFCCHSLQLTSEAGLGEALCTKWGELSCIRRPAPPCRLPPCLRSVSWLHSSPHEFWVATTLPAQSLDLITFSSGHTAVVALLETTGMKPL